VDPSSLALASFAAAYPSSKVANTAPAIDGTGKREIPIPYPDPNSLHPMAVKRVTLAFQRPNRLERCCHETFRQILRLNE
jgi:hypothetical protein